MRSTLTSHGMHRNPFGDRGEPEAEQARHELGARALLDNALFCLSANGRLADKVSICVSLRRMPPDLIFFDGLNSPRLKRSVAG